MEIHFAPLQGYADNHYRRLHAEFYGGIDTYYTPFIRVEKGEPRRQDMSRFTASMADGTPTIPQIIFNSAEEFRILRDALKDSGTTAIDLNLGCPYPMQTRKGRGCAMIGNIEVLREVSNLINSDSDISYSVKMRLGMTNANEWQDIIPILNDTRLEHITLHPRVAKDMYGGEMNLAEFEKFVAASGNPVIFNGDILTVADIERVVSTYPEIKGIMIGRGMLARPSLAREWLSGEEWHAEKRLEKLMRFHDALLECYESTLCGQTQILQKIKPFWDYLEPEIGHKKAKAIKKATTLMRYREAVL